MSTISFSVEETLKQDVASWAKKARKSKSDIFRDMALVYGFSQQMDSFTKKTEAALLNLGITTEPQLEEYLNSDETYKDRLRHKRLSSRSKKQ